MHAHQHACTAAFTIMVIAPTAVIIDLPNSLFMCAKAEIDQLQYEPWMLGANTVRKYKTLEVGKAGKHAYMPASAQYWWSAGVCWRWLGEGEGAAMR
jgi:hypothetical protein